MHRHSHLERINTLRSLFRFLPLVAALLATSNAAEHVTFPAEILSDKIRGGLLG